MKNFALALLFAATGATSALAAVPNAPHRAMAPIFGATSPAHGSILLSYSPSFGGILKNKGVSTVTSPGTGVFCVVPIKAVNAAAVPVVTVEWGSSSGFSLEAFVDLANAFCPAGNIEVLTYTFDANGAVLSNLVAFDVVVP